MPYKDPEKRKEASAASAKRWAQRHPEQARTNAREWRRRNPECILVHSAKRRAKEKGIVFELTTENCPRVPEFCPILGIKLEMRPDGVKGPWNASPTLDRIDPNKGYTVDNVRVISFQANRMKSDMTIEMLERLISYMRGEL